MAKVCKAWEEQKQLGIEEGRQEERKSIIIQLGKEGFSIEKI